MNRSETISISEQETLENQGVLNQQADFADSNIPVSSEDPQMNSFSDENTSTDKESQHHEEDLKSIDDESQKQESYRQNYEKFLLDLEKLNDHESKLQFAIDFMESSLAQPSTPHFKSFWEARGLCLQLFKENISPALRASLWNKYNELSKEARRLKEILDEQSAFAVEQIEIAVKSLEDDIAAFDEHVKKMQDIEFDVASKALSKRLPHYQQVQKELNLLNTQASRINALRKELIRTEMRVRQKNKFFQRLSVAGDKVFPRRKELIKDISQCFVEDVDAFISAHFKSNEFKESLFTLREEIKSLQNAAKILTLNTHAFTHTRMHLSECWDKIKNEEKDRKKERAQQKTIFKQNFDAALKKIHEFKHSFQERQFPYHEAAMQLDEISNYIRTLELGRDEIRALREQFNEARKPVLDKQHAEELEHQKLEQEREKQRRNKLQEIKQEIDTLVKTTSDSLDYEALSAKRDEILEKIHASHTSKAEKQEIERHLKSLRDLISEKKESSLLSLSDDERQSLEQLREVLNQKKARRQEIKDQIKKASSMSGMDFAQAMNFNLQMAQEKERLEKINQGIKEIEKKIADLEK